MKYLNTLSLFLLLSSFSIAQEMNLNKEFLKIENYISVMEKSEKEISKAPVKWHLLHLLQVIKGVIDNAASSDPAEFNSKSNLVWKYTSLFGKIPRGKITSPDVVNPKFEITEIEIRTAIEDAKLRVSQWGKLKQNNFYNHHILLHLNKRKIKRFLKVHTRHHLRIVRDITKD